jgi:hypothetical protein
LPEDELRYFRQIDEALRPVLKDPGVPLVLAGAEKDASLYRQVNTYKGLLHDGVLGNPDRLSMVDLHKKAQTIAQAHYDETRKQAILEYTERMNASRTSHRLEEIVPAAYQGRIYHLFVAAGAERWGRFDADQNLLSVHETAEKGDKELLNLAVIQTILRGGSVYCLDAASVPDGSVVAALFRY